MEKSFINIDEPNKIKVIKTMNNCNIKEVYTHFNGSIMKVKKI